MVCIWVDWVKRKRIKTSIGWPETRPEPTSHIGVAGIWCCGDDLRFLSPWCGGNWPDTPHKKVKVSKAFTGMPNHTPQLQIASSTIKDFSFSSCSQSCCIEEGAFSIGNHHQWANNPQTESTNGGCLFFLLRCQVFLCAWKRTCFAINLRGIAMAGFSTFPRRFSLCAGRRCKFSFDCANTTKESWAFHDFYLTA